MLDRLKEIENRYNQIEKELSKPEALADQEKYRELSKTYGDLKEIVEKITDYRGVLDQIKEAEEMLSAEELDHEMESFVRSELTSLKERKGSLENELNLMLLPKDKNDEKDVIMEVRAGAGGEEASLFARDLFRMYSKYAEAKGWKTEVLSSSLSDMGGFKEVIFAVKGRNTYGELKFEFGVHRVQRIPVTESGGRIHTSTATVAVLPEAEEVEVKIDPKDLKIETFRSSGPGGQHVNVTDSAVRVTHLPTGIAVSCQEERSQFQNRERALRVLRARLYQQALERKQAELAESRRIQVGTGERSEKIRTYNFPQGRVTDHRINLTLHRLDEILEGDIGEIIQALSAVDRTKRLEKAAR
ncbi:MAG: peptide chain release factor 1 [Actinomycetota bacterium]